MENNYQDEIAKILIKIESVKFSFKYPFTLTSGHKSPVYVDCRKIISYTKERNQILDYAEQYIIKNILFCNLTIFICFLKMSKCFICYTIMSYKFIRP